jgi:tripartite-type tricarboxylate transporter receptor subunit TctC
MNASTKFGLGGLLCMCMAALNSSMASDAWPQQPIKVVVAYPAGAMGDLVMRLLSDELGKQLKQPVIIDNRAGAGGNIGASAVAHAKPDGYTILVAATNNYSINQYVYKNMGFDVQEDLLPVSLLVNVPSVLFANSQLPAASYAEFAQYAKQHPGKVNYGSPGAGTPPHLVGELLNQQAGLGMLHVPYKGSSFALTALLANDVQVMLVGSGIGLPFVKTGKLKALAVGTDKRMVEIPEVPTFAEIGMKNLPANNWWGAAVPKGTPQEIIQKLNQAFDKTLSKPDIRRKLTELGAPPVGGAPEVMRNMVEQDNQFWQARLKTMKLD